MWLNIKNNTKYGNWVPRSIIYFFIFVFLILILPTLFPITFLLKVVLWIIAGIWIIPFAYMIYLYYYFSTQNNIFQYKMWNFVIAHLQWNGKGKALEVGTGAGGLAIQIAKRFPESHMWGIDYWGKTWDYSKEQCEKNAINEDVGNQMRFEKASASDLPYNDDEFDAIVSNFVYHEVRDTKDKIELIKESLRVLKKGGFFSLHDTFKNKRRYGDLEELLNHIKEWDVHQVNFIETTDEISMPFLIKSEFKKMGLIYGIK